MALEITSSRAVLIVFPNIFAFWFLFVAALQHWWPNHELTLNRLATWVVGAVGLENISDVLAPRGEMAG
jgi:membrane-bound metal-dependent hydrolase YbcI (DUF457 family)